MSVEIGQGLKTTFVTALGNVHFIFYKELTGMPDTYFGNEFGEGLICMGLEVPAKGSWRQICKFRHLRNGNLFLKIFHDIGIDLIHALGIAFF